MEQNIYIYEYFGIAWGVVRASDEDEALVKVREHYNADSARPIDIREIPDYTDVIEIFG